MGNSSPAPVRKLRVTIVGHASPRWRGAASNTDADRLNAILANQRADAVFAAVEKLLRVRLGGNLTIEKNITLAPGAPQPDLTLSGHGEGSREALEQHKDRSSDFDTDRRVEVSIELVVTEDATGRVSLPTIQATSYTWSVTVNRLKLVRAGYAAGGIEIAIKNRTTGKEVLATARLDGPGWFRLWPFATEEDTGRKHVWFNTAEPVSIQDFEGTEIKVSKVDAKLLLGESFMYVTFPRLAPYSSAMMYHHFGVGLPNGFHVWGNLHLYGDTAEPVDREDDVQSTLDRRSNESLLIIFSTGQYVVPNSDAGRLDGFVTTWSRELLQRQPNQGPPG